MTTLTIDRYFVRNLLRWVEDGEATRVCLGDELDNARGTKRGECIQHALTAVLLQLRQDVFRLRDEGALLHIGAVGA